MKQRVCQRWFAMGAIINIWKLVSVCMITVAMLSSPVGAYVLKGPHLLELMTARSDRVKSLQVSQKLFIYNLGNGGEPVELKETLRYVFPWAFRSDIESEHATRIHLKSQNSVVTIIDGNISAETETGSDLYKDIILYHSRVSLNERLTLLGVDITVTSLGRFEDKIAYVLGAQYPDESYSQIWIDRETFRPFRWLMIKPDDDNQKEVLEFRYLEWQQVQGAWYPMQIEFYQGGRLTRQIRVNHIRVNPTFPETLFDIVRIKSMHQTRSGDQDRKDGREEISDLEKTIEEFKKMYE